MSEITDAEKDALIDTALKSAGAITGYGNSIDRAIFDAGVKHGMERAADLLDRCCEPLLRDGLLNEYGLLKSRANAIRKAIP
jgi:lysozyme family protein